MQLEHLTGGRARAGYHEVVLTAAARAATLAARGREESLWRISSTVFAHINSDAVPATARGLAEEAPNLA